MALKLNKKTSAPAVVTTEMKKSGKVVTQSTETVDTPFDTAVQSPCSEVGMEASVTVNLGDYESVRLGVTLSVPCPVGEHQHAFEGVRTWVEETLAQLRSEL